MLQNTRGKNESFCRFSPMLLQISLNLLTCIISIFSRFMFLRVEETELFGIVWHRRKYYNSKANWGSFLVLSKISIKKNQQRHRKKINEHNELPLNIILVSKTSGYFSSSKRTIFMACCTRRRAIMLYKIRQYPLFRLVLRAPKQS